MIDQSLIKQRALVKFQLDYLDKKIAQSFWDDYLKLCAANDIDGVIEIINQLPNDFKHIHKLWQAAMEMQNAKKKSDIEHQKGN